MTPPTILHTLVECFERSADASHKTLLRRQIEATDRQINGWWMSCKD